MSTTKQGEPTMEEILASIRKIISEDAEAPKPADAAAAPEPAPAAAPPPPPAVSPTPPPARDEPVLELTDMVKEDGSIEKVKQPAEDLVMTESSPTAASVPQGDLVSGHAAATTASAFAGLANVVSSSRSMPLGNGQKTLEDLAKELLRPMLKDWLDAHLPVLVERLVQREISKLAGQ